MIFFVVVAVVALILFAWFLPSMFAGATGARVDVGVLSTQMMNWHSAAARTCFTDDSCVDKRIDGAEVRKQMPSFMQASGLDGRMVSGVSAASNDAAGARRRYVLTFVTDGAALVGTPMGLLSSRLRGDVGDTGTFVGRYDKVAGKVKGDGVEIWVDTGKPVSTGGLVADATTSTCSSATGSRTCSITRTVDVAVPSGVSSQVGSVPDDAPVLVSRIGFDTTAGATPGATP